MNTQVFYTQWLARLEHQPVLLSTWLRHQTRDDYWKHGSIREDFAAIEVPVFIIAGWGDGYKNAPPAALANLKSTVKAMTGPWIHKYPHFAWPKPRADFHAEAIAWWDRWLKGELNGVEELPAYRAYQAVIVPPGSHDVTFRFRPWRPYAGAAVSLATVLFAALAVPALFLRSGSVRPPLTRRHER